MTFASAEIEQINWQRATVDGQPHPLAFVRGPNEIARSSVKQTRESCFVESALSGLQVLKTSESGFEGYIVDKYTTLKPTNDRIFATTVDASWRWEDHAVNCDQIRASVREAIIRLFAKEYSPSVQYTIYRIGQTILEENASIKDITLAMPNQHRLWMDMSKLGFENPNLIFCPTDEPYGDITATIGRT